MLRIKKSHIAEQWILYDTKDFSHHTHCYELKIAKIIRNNVTNKRMPKTTNKRLLVSHMRVNNDVAYMELIKNRLEELESNGKLQRGKIF